MTHQNLPPDDPRVIACDAAKRMFGTQAALAERVGEGLKRSAIGMWSIVPERWVLPVERATGISRYKLRPDVFGSAEDLVVDDFALAARVALKSQALADAIGVPLAAMASWDKVPPELVLKVERATGISRHKLRPDVFGDAEGMIVAADIGVAAAARIIMADALEADKVPAELVLKIERVTGVSRHKLRPDVFGPAEEVAA